MPPDFTILLVLFGVTMAVAFCAAQRQFGFDPALGLLVAFSTVAAMLGLLISLGFVIDFTEGNPWAVSVLGVVTIALGGLGPALPIGAILLRRQVVELDAASRWVLAAFAPWGYFLVLLVVACNTGVPLFLE